MLDAWMKKWGIPHEAIKELLAEFAPPSVNTKGKSEAVVQARVRLEQAKQGCILWRNNVGGFEGVRYGLANESSQMNRILKSSDLIGIRRVTITPEMVGKTIGQFVAIECKKEGWKFSGTPHENSQLRFLLLVASYGGEGKFES